MKTAEIMKITTITLLLSLGSLAVIAQQKPLQKPVTPVPDTSKYALVMNAQQVQLQFQINDVAKQAIPYLPESVMPDAVKVNALKQIDVNLAFLRQAIQKMNIDTTGGTKVKPNGTLPKNNLKVKKP